jgi:AcrR family transcriptional regulator
VGATRRLMSEGVTPTVEQAAAEAAIGRATAYRYFPNQRALLTATFPTLDERSLLGDKPPGDLRDRLEIVVDAIARQAVQHEAELRNMLRLSLEPDPSKRGELPFRVGRRIMWVAEALAPLRGQVPGRDFDRLVHSIAAAVGIDALVWLTDVAGLSREGAVETMRWSARALLEAVSADAPALR